MTDINADGPRSEFIDPDFGGGNSSRIVINESAGEAEITGAVTSKALYISNGPTWNVIELVGGGLNVITMFYTYSYFDRGAAMPFVHSRHLDLNGAAPSQWYGCCRGPSKSE